MAYCLSFSLVNALAVPFGRQTKILVHNAIFKKQVPTSRMVEGVAAAASNGDTLEGVLTWERMAGMAKGSGCEDLEVRRRVKVHVSMMMAFTCIGGWLSTFIPWNWQ
jgi:hypothetical protein